MHGIEKKERQLWISDGLFNKCAESAEILLLSTRKVFRELKVEMNGDKQTGKKDGSILSRLVAGFPATKKLKWISFPTLRQGFFFFVVTNIRHTRCDTSHPPFWKEITQIPKLLFLRDFFIPAGSDFILFLQDRIFFFLMWMDLRLYTLYNIYVTHTRESLMISLIWLDGGNRFIY